MIGRATQLAQQIGFFHWELEFPEAFFDRSGRRLPAGGFDAVIGNPPWDMMRADSGPAESRSGSRADVAPLVRFARDSGIYTAQSGGHANRYQLFVERALSLTRAGGRIGLVLPSGLVSDHGSSRLRARLLGDADVDAIVGFDNQRAVFPIHRSVRFLLVTATAGAPTRTIALRLGERDPGALEGIDERIDEAAPLASASFPVRLTPDALRHISGDTLSIPDLRAPIDLANRSFGQAVAVTPIQLATSYSALANGGTLWEPHVAWKIESSWSRAAGAGSGWRRPAAWRRRGPGWWSPTSTPPRGRRRRTRWTGCSCPST